MTRVAFTLPSLPPAALVRRLVDDVVEALREAGAEVECFAEADRCHEDDRVFHYLRLAGRHAARPFTHAVYPLGRDYRVWEASFVLLHRFPGTTWALDPVPGHMAVAGVAIRGRWDHYREMAEAEIGDRGATVVDVLASGWGSRAFHRRFDLVRPRLAGQEMLLGRTPAIRDRMGSIGPPTETLSLPGAGTLEDRSQPGAAEAGAAPELLVAGFNVRWPWPLVRVLDRIGPVLGEGRARILYPQVLFDAYLADAARSVASEERVEWIAASDRETQLRRVAAADIVIYLDADPSVEDAALLQAAMASGGVVVVPDIPSMAELPTDGVVRVASGRALEESLLQTLTALLESPELRCGVAARGADWAGRPRAREVASSLLELLPPGPADRSVRRLTGEVWDRLPERVVDRCLAGSTPRHVRERLEASLRRLTPPGGS